MPKPKILHKAHSQYLQGCDDYDVWTECGLGDGHREVDFEIAMPGQAVTCKRCLASMERKRKRKALAAGGEG